jgi:hypothetical protein
MPAAAKPLPPNPAADAPSFFQGGSRARNRYDQARSKAWPCLVAGAPAHVPGTACFGPTMHAVLQYRPTARPLTQPQALPAQMDQAVRRMPQCSRSPGPSVPCSGGGRMPQLWMPPAMRLGAAAASAMRTARRALPPQPAWHPTIHSRSGRFAGFGFRVHGSTQPKGPHSGLLAWARPCAECWRRRLSLSMVAQQPLPSRCHPLRTRARSLPSHPRQQPATAAETATLLQPLHAPRQQWR